MKIKTYTKKNNKTKHTAAQRRHVVLIRRKHTHFGSTIGVERDGGTRGLRSSADGPVVLFEEDGTLRYPSECKFACGRINLGE